MKKVLFLSLFILFVLVVAVCQPVGPPLYPRC